MPPIPQPSPPQFILELFKLITKLESEPEQHLEDCIKQKLKEAREAIEQYDLSDEAKSDIVNQLNSLTAELEKPKPNVSRAQRFWNRIIEVF